VLGRARRWPRWAAVLLGVVAVGLGALLALRPFASLATLLALVAVVCVVNGVVELVSAPDRRLPVVAGACWLIAALVVVGWPGLGLRALAVVVGIALVVAGVLRVVAAVRGTTDERAADALLGVAEIGFGVLALALPDVTLLVVAVVFGARTVIFGVALLVVGGVRGTAHPSPTGRPPWLRGLRVVVAAAAVVAAFALLVVAGRVRDAAPVVDAFYSAPGSLPAHPGELLRAEPYATAVPAGSEAWRILYTSTRDDRTPVLASAVVMAARNRPSGPRPVVLWAHGTTGFAQNCAPSLLANGFSAGALPALDRIAGSGWVLVAPDYVGLGTAAPHPYLVGPPVARSVLDAVRAARKLPDISLSDRTVVWGHSQGGGAALWTGGIAASYAPDVPLAGVAALAPASDLPALVGNLDAVPGGSIFASFVVAGYTSTYPDVRFDDYVRPEAQVFVRAIAGRCLAEPEVLLSVGSALAFDGSIFRTSPTTGAFGRRLRENVPVLRVAAPLFVGQGLADALVLPDRQADYVRQLCRGGQQLEYRTYPGQDHVGVVGPQSALVPDLLRWTADRFDGKPSPSTC